MYRHAYVWHTYELFYAHVCTDMHTYGIRMSCSMPARRTYPPATILPLLAATKLESAPHACSWSPKAYTGSLMPHTLVA